jgi:hypothetical protein
MQILPSQPVSIAKILDTSIKLYIASFPKLIGFFLIMAVFYVASGLVSIQLVNAQADNSVANPEALLALLPLYIGVIFILSLATLVLYAAIIYRMDNVAHGREDTFMEALQLGLKKFPAMFMAIIIFTIAMMGGLVLLVIPGIILLVSMGFYIYFIVIESLGGYAAIRASHSLVWGNWWRTTAVFMAPGIVLTIMYFTLVMLVTFLGNGLTTGASVKGFAEISANVLSAFITPYFFTLGYVQFNDLKLRKSGADLAIRLAK